MDKEDSARVVEVLGGAAEAFRPLVEKYQDILFDLAFRLAHNREEAEDVVQTAFARMYARLSQYDPRRPFSTWAYTVTLNVARNHVRRKALLRFFSLDRSSEEDPDMPFAPEPADARQDIDSLVRGREIAAELRARVRALPLRLRESFILHYLHHVPVGTVAEMLGTSVNTVKLRLFRARKTMYPHFAGRFPEEMGLAAPENPGSDGGREP